MQSSQKLDKQKILESLQDQRKKSRRPIKQDITENERMQRKPRS